MVISRSKNRWGKSFLNSSPAVRNEAEEEMRQETRRWRLHLRSDKSLEDVSRMFNPKVQGRIDYLRQHLSQRPQETMDIPELAGLSHEAYPPYFTPQPA